jgi:transcriptional regulator with XRE-family HTH domain
MSPAEKLKELRKKRNLSQYKLSKKSGISQSFISAIEPGKKSPTISTLDKICDSLGISIQDFFCEVSSNIPPLINKLVKESRHLSPEQNKKLLEFLLSMRKSSD